MSKPPRRTLVLGAGIAATVLILMVAVIFTILFVHQKYEAARHPSREVPWLSSQLETEYLRTSEALRLYRAGIEVSHAQLLLRFDIYWSRVDLMAQGAQAANIRHATWLELEPALYAALSALDAVLADPDFHRTAEGQAAISQHMAVWTKLHAFSQQSIRFIWTHNVEREREAMITVVAAMAVALVLVMLVAGVILVMARGQSRLARSERLAKEQALESTRMLERFLASVSHELRTPLNAIIGFSEVMSLGQLGPLDRKYRDYAGDILSSGRHLLRLVDQLLSISGSARQTAEDEQSVFDISGVLDEGVKMIAILAREKDVALTLDIRQDYRIAAERQKLAQIVVNLVSNAVKFTPPGGAVSVGLDEGPAGGIAITVRDTGVGMSEEVRARAFEPFYRSPDPYVSSNEGSGLGLAISRDAADRMGFGLRLESTPGEGTVVVVEIPAGRGRPVASRSDTAPADARLAALRTGA